MASRAKLGAVTTHDVEALHAQQQAFAAHAGHELRGPLGALCAALEVLESRMPADPVAADAVQVASRQARELEQRIDDLLPRSGGLRLPAG